MDIELPEGLAQSVVRGEHHALPTGMLGGGALEPGAVEGKCFLLEGLRQGGSGPAEEGPAQVDAPLVRRKLLHHAAKLG